MALTGVVTLEKIPIMKRALLLFAVAATLSLLPSGARGQTYSIDWYTIDGGGGTSTGGAYSLSGTIGQPDAGGMSGGSFSIDGGFWSGIPTEPNAAPTLHIIGAGPNYTVSWSPGTTGFILQVADKLSPSSWTDAPSAATNPASVPAGAGTRFYRLRQP